MKLALEPKEIDLVVEPHEYTKSDSEKMSRIISHYKATGELLKLGNTNTKLLVKKELIMSHNRVDG